MSPRRTSMRPRALDRHLGRRSACGTVLAMDHSATELFSSTYAIRRQRDRRAVNIAIRPASPTTKAIQSSASRAVMRESGLSEEFVELAWE